MIRIIEKDRFTGISNLQEGMAILVDKPLDWTSFDVVNKIRNALKKALNKKKIKVGHAGTLDPKATGLLILCIGGATKKVTQFQDLGKEYIGQFYIGASTPSYDQESEIDFEYETDHITEDLIRTSKDQFLGTIDQLPPIYSAIKKDGVRLYKKARAGEEVILEPRKVTIDSFDITDIKLPLVSFMVKCQKGTYIRSLAHDFGKSLQSGAYLYSLKRTMIGPYNVKDAWTIEAFCNALSESTV